MEETVIIGGACTAIARERGALKDVGAIALGHLIAGTLAILVVKAVCELLSRGGRHALVTACCGGGQGVVTVLERC